MIVVDASIAAAWFLDERQSPFAAALLQSEVELIAPDLMPAEVGSALVRAFRRNLIASEEVGKGLATITAGLVTLHPTTPLLTAACDLACKLRGSIYDATYLELARRNAALLVTADGRLAGMAASLGVRAHRPEDGPLPDRV